MIQKIRSLFGRRKSEQPQPVSESTLESNAQPQSQPQRRLLQGPAAALRKFTLGVGLIVATVLGFVAFDYLLNAYRFQMVPKNFSVVKHQVLYRSGQMKPHHFQEVLRDYGIKTVFILNEENRAQEREICRQMGVRAVNYTMPGSGIGEAEYFHEYLRLVEDPANRPVLVHCAAGAYRTGVSVALYRMLYEGWQLEDTVREMKYSGFAGQQEVIEHVRMVYDTIPADLKERVMQKGAMQHAARF